MSASSPFARVRALLIVGLASAGLAIGGHVSGALDALEQHGVDVRFAHREAQAPDDVVVVAVDDTTFSDLGRQWPFPRSLFGRAVDRLHAAGAGQIVLDIQFTEATRPSEDFALYDAIDRAGGAVLATSQSDARGRTNVLGGDENLAAIRARAAASNLPDESHGVVRRFTGAVGRLKTIGVAVAERAGHRVVPEARGEQEPWIDFHGPPGTVPTVSFSDLVRGRVAAQRLRGKTVVIGTSSPTLHDTHPTSTTEDRPMSGPEVQANAIWTVMHDVPLRSAQLGIDLLAILVLSLAVPLLALRVRPVIAALAAPLLAGAYALIAQAAFEAGTVVTVAYPLAALAVSAVCTVAVSHLMETLERRRVAEVNELLEHKVQAATHDLRATELEIVQRLGQALDSRDEDTGDHIGRIGELCHRLALAAGLSAEEAELLRRASALHDIGKIAVPDNVLRKPGRLDAAEWDVMRRHTTIGAEILAGSRSALVQLAEVVARTHHERWDGSGYPLGLAGEQIPLVGRICAVCDVFDALTSERPYKSAWSVQDALAEIREQSGRHFDPRLVELFLAGAVAAPVASVEAELLPETVNV